MTLINVIGIGSPFSDDQVGLWVVAQLRKEQRLQNDIEKGRLVLETCDRPGLALVNKLKPAAFNIIIDAVHDPDRRTGKLLHLTVDELLSQDQQISSHGFGVSEALQLAVSLQQLPSRLEIYAINIDQRDGAVNQQLSPTIQQVAETLVHQLVELLDGGQG